MSTSIWIAIAAIMLPFITSWSQFLLKEHLEKKKALAAATSATNQPKPDKPPVGIGQNLSKRRKTLPRLMLWAALSSALQVATSLLFGTMTANFSSVMALIYSFTAAVLVTVVFFQTGEF